MYDNSVEVFVACNRLNPCTKQRQLSGGDKYVGLLPGDA
jgi:hypothetical protein